MKCGMMIEWRTLKSGKRKIRQAFNRLQAQLASENGSLPKAMTRCDGKIIAKIAAIDEPTWGGTSATLEIEFRCDICRMQHYTGLPRSGEELSQFVTDAVAAITPSDEMRLLIEARKEHNRQEAQQRKILEELHQSGFKAQRSRRTK